MYLNHKHLLVHLSCHSITKTKQGPFRCTGDILYCVMVLTFSFARWRCRFGATLVVGLGGWLVLAGGAEVVLSGCAGLLSIEAVRKRWGAGYCHGHVYAAGMVLSRAKAFTDAFVGGDGGGALVVSFSLWGHHCVAPCSYCT